MKQRYLEMLEPLKKEVYYKEYMGNSVNFMKSSTGSWEGLYVYEEAGTYHLDYCERGHIDSILKSRSEEEILESLISNILFSLSVEYELHNRIADQDSRRIIFSKNLKYFSKYLPNKLEDRVKYYEHTLSISPFSDSLCTHEIITYLYNQWDPMGLLSFGAPDDEYNSEIDDLTARLYQKELSIPFIKDQIYEVGKYWFGDSYDITREKGSVIASQLFIQLKKDPIQNP